MSNIKYSVYFLLAFFGFFTACQQPGANDPGSEFMPDMAHSVANEANVMNDYSFNTWEEASTKSSKETSMPRLPVSGTIPRGYAGKGDASHLNGTATINAMAIPANGSVPYYYEDTEEERSRAANEIRTNPFPIDSHSLIRGQVLYNIQCGICHGGSGNGNGWLVDEVNPNAKYPAAPANFLQDTFYNSTNGRFYHAIVYGKNVMGGYTDKLSYKERWEVIHYIKSLMAKSTEKEYNHMVNTFSNNANDTPCCPNGQWRHDGVKKVVAQNSIQDGIHGPAGSSHGSGNGHDGDGGHGEGNHEIHEHGGENHNDHEGHDNDSGHSENHDGDHSHGGDH